MCPLKVFYEVDVGYISILNHILEMNENDDFEGDSEEPSKFTTSKGVELEPLKDDHSIFTIYTENHEHYVSMPRSIIGERDAEMLIWYTIAKEDRK